MVNPRHIAINPEIFGSIKDFCMKNGLKIGRFTEEALLMRMSEFKEKFKKS